MTTPATATEKLKIAVIIASTREGRFGERVARWIHRITDSHEHFAAELVDLRDHPLPNYAQPGSPKQIENSYTDETMRRWVEVVNRFDGYIFVLPEYNHGYPGSLKNALDHVYTGWNKKPAAFVSYGGSSGGIRAVQQLRQVVIELQMAPLRDEVNIPFVGRAFDPAGEIADPFHGKRAAAMLEQLRWWGETLRAGRRAGA